MTANRRTPSAANTSLPTDAVDFLTDVDEEIPALWKRTIDRLKSVAGTNAITGTLADTDVAALAILGQIGVILRPANNNTGAVTLNIDTLGVKDVLDVDGNALSSGELVAGRDHFIAYDGTAWRLVANGSAPPPTIAAPGPVLLDTKVASASSSLRFETGLDDTYDRYKISIENLRPATADVYLMLRVGVGATPTYQSTNYQGYGHFIANNSDGLFGSGVTNGVALAYTSGSSAGMSNSAGSFSAEITFANPESTDIFNVMYQSQYYGTNTFTFSCRGGGMWTGAQAVTAIELLMQSGNITSGTARLYGWPK